MRVLALDTSTSHGSVALLDSGRLLLDESCISDRNHGSTLVPLLQRAHAYKYARCARLAGARATRVPSSDSRTRQSR